MVMLYRDSTQNEVTNNFVNVEFAEKTVILKLFAFENFKKNFMKWGGWEAEVETHLI